MHADIGAYTSMQKFYIGNHEGPRIKTRYGTAWRIFILIQLARVHIKYTCCVHISFYSFFSFVLIVQVHFKQQYSCASMLSAQGVFSPPDA